jgi:hypothetical protein
MKAITVFCLLISISIGFTSCDILSPVDYDKAGRDLSAMLSNDPSLTISEYQHRLKETGMSSKDFFTIIKNDPKEMASFSKNIQYLSLDGVQDKIKEYDIDVKNLKRALGL